MKKIPDLHYREATMADFEAVKALSLLAYSEFEAVLQPVEWQVFYGNNTNDAALKELMHVATVFLCLAGADAVGVAFIVPKGNPTKIYGPDCCYLRKVGVHPAYRGAGIAGALTRLCIDFAKRNGETKIMLHTSVMMPAARHIYEQFGFRIVKDLGLMFGQQYWLYELDLS